MSAPLEVKIVLNVHVATGEPAVQVARFVNELERTLARRVAVEAVPAKPIEAPKPRLDAMGRHAEEVIPPVVVTRRTPATVAIPTPAPARVDVDEDLVDDDGDELAGEKITVARPRLERRPCGCGPRGPHARTCASRGAAA